MIGLQEMNRRLEKEDNKEPAKQVREMLNGGYYDHNEFNIYGKGWIQQRQGINPIKAADAQAIYESIQKIPLREFLAKSGTSGIAGAAFLVPTKIYSVMYDSAVEADIVPAISIAMVPPEQIGGVTMNVDIAMDETYKPHKQQSGSKMPDEEIQAKQATLNFEHYFGINFAIGNDLIEDAQFDVVEMHLRNAGREMGEFASNEALTVAYVSTDGDGTLNVNAATGNAAETKFQGGTTNDVCSCVKAVVDDGFVPDTMCTTHEAMIHSILSTVGTTSNESTFWDEFAHNGWPTTMAGMNVVYADTDIMTTNKAFTACKTIIFDKDYAFLSGRKRWLRIENYSEPVKDITGATITARQDTVSVYNDSVAYMYET